MRPLMVRDGAVGTMSHEFAINAIVIQAHELFKAVIEFELWERVRE